MSERVADARWRAAGPQDAEALRDLEREASLVGLAHVFPAEQYPFPDEAVLYRWAMTLAEPDVRVEVVDRPGGGLLAFVAHDAATLRHLAVRPDAWGAGLATAGVHRVVTALAPVSPVLWVLEDNHRARALYERLGWTATGTTQKCPWVPHPIELQYRAPEHGRG